MANKALLKKWESLDDCLHVIGAKCPCGQYNRSYHACTVCMLVAKGYSLTDVYTRPLPNPDHLESDEVDWLRVAVQHALDNYYE